MSTASDILSTVCGDHEHRDAVKLYKSTDTGIPFLCCDCCDWTCNIYNYVTSPPDGDKNYFHSCELAEKYARLTGDVNVPVSYHLAPEDFDGIVVTEPVIVPLKTLSNAVQLQRLVNSPFVKETSTKAAPQPMILKHFVYEFSNSVTHSTAQRMMAEENDSEKKEVMLALHQMLGCMKEFLNSDVDIFKHYHENLVPFVEECARYEENTQNIQSHESFPLSVEAEKELQYPLSLQLLLQWKRAAKIRRKFSKFSVMFDMVHVMIACYACSTNVPLVANFTFDLMGRIFRGDFLKVETRAKRLVRDFIDKHVSYSNNSELYYAVREMKCCRSEESLSVLLPKYAKLENLIKDRLQLDETSFSHAFPAALYDSNVAEYIGFQTALSQIYLTIDSKGRLPKGVISTARELHRTFREWIQKMNAFNPDCRLPWTMDTFHAFLACDPKLEKDFAKIMELMVFTNNKNTPATENKPDTTCGGEKKHDVVEDSFSRETLASVKRDRRMYGGGARVEQFEKEEDMET